MPLGVKPVCSVCKTSVSPIWKKGLEGEILCNSCGVKHNGTGSSDGKADTNLGKGNGNGSASQNSGPVRKSTRVKPSKYRTQAGGKALATKGKNRRMVFKKNPIKAPTAVATIVTRDYVFYDGIYWQIGDIVSVMDVGGGIYYAQIQGFLQDQYCQKSVVINWLLPTTSSPKDGFDPATYILGPCEELPRPMDAFTFVCRAPSDYFKSKSEPYPTKPDKPELGFIWTSIGPEITRVPTQEEIFGLRDTDSGDLSKDSEKRGRKAVKSKAKDTENSNSKTKVKVEAKEEIVA